MWVKPAAGQNDVPSSTGTENTLNLTLVSPGAPPPSAHKVKTPTESAKRTVAVANAKSRGLLPPLSSRGTARVPRQAPTPPPKILAQMGFVIADPAELRVTTDSSTRLLSKVPKGTHVAVVAESGEYWGVLMLNNTVGWTPKSNLEMLDYQTQIALPSTPDPSEPSVSPDVENYIRNNAGMSLQVQGVLREAFTYLNVPYVWGGNTRNGLDCSAFVRACFHTEGVELPRHSGDQIVKGRPVAGADLRAGDRLYFDCSARMPGIDHTGIYIGNGLFVHASGGHGRVVVESLFKPLYVKGLVAIRRDFE